ncbi:MAG: hypothetical protein H6739_23805 [Alphaproteobacteria bacterium]|nr:hypothetical protein [Alphaproteobacteria bacterium]
MRSLVRVVLLIGILTGPTAEAAEPGHLRAVAAPPAELAGLSGDRPVRVWWDDDGAVRTVEASWRGRWEVVARDARPGVTLRSLPPEVQLRLVDPLGQGSAPVGVTWALGPAGVARLAAPEALPGREVSDLSPTEAGAWGALLDGGLVRLDKGHLRVEPYGLAEGLPAELVLSVAADGARAWVGTAAGLALVEDGAVVRVWDRRDGLPDDWVQAVAPDGDGVWAGTYRGLARVTLSTTAPVLTPWSVFSITRGVDARAWVGYEGLRGLPDGEPIEGVDPALNIWDVDVFQPRIYLATDTEGVLLLEEGILRPFWSPPTGSAFALERVGGALYVAADTAGLVELSEVQGPRRAWGRADGLPSDTVYEVVEGPPGKLWVGTDAGVALVWPGGDTAVPWPRSPAAAGVPARAVLGDKRWVLLASDEGLAALGRLPRGWRDALGLPGPVVALARSEDTLWVIGATDAWRVRRGRLQRIPLPAEVEHAAFVDGNLWVGGPSGLHRYDAGAERFVPGPVRTAVTAMCGDGGQLLWVGTRSHIVAVDRAGATRNYLRARTPTSLAATPEAVWVGSPNGLQRLDPLSGEVDDLGELGWGVLGLGTRPGEEPYAALDTGAVVRAYSGLPVSGLAPGQAGEVTGLTVDDHGRVWLLGETGFTVLER